MGWSEKYKKSIDCDNPKGFSQRAHCQGRKKKMNEAKEKDHEVSMAKTQVKKSIDNLQKVARVLAKKTDADNLPAWVQAKLTDTEHNTDAAASYMEEGKRDGKSAKDKDYSLRDWFSGGGWVQAGGKYDGKPCAKQPGQKTKPFCRDADDRAAMSKDEREKRAKKKRKEDPNPNRKGKAKIVREQVKLLPGESGADALRRMFRDNKKLAGGVGGRPEDVLELPSDSKLKLAQHFEPKGEQLDELAPLVAGGLALGAGALGLAAIRRAQQASKSGVEAAKKGEKIQPGTGIGHASYGMQRHNDATREALKLLRQETEVKGQLIDEKKDACYKKVKARYDVWPSAYASGALVKCRKVGADNWGTKKEGYEFSNWRDDFKALEIETIDLIKPEPLVSEQSAYDPKYPLGKKVGDNQLPSNLSRKPRFKRATPSQSSYADGVSTDAFAEAKEDPCWDGYKQVGMKKKGGKMVPNCVKEGYSNWREELEEDWQKVNKSDKTDGMSQKAVNAYRRENPGSKLKTAVTEKDPGPGRSKRRKSFCARSKGQQDMHNIDCSKDPDKAICKARRRWKC